MYTYKNKIIKNRPKTHVTTYLRFALRGVIHHLQCCKYPSNRINPPQRHKHAEPFQKSLRLTRRTEKTHISIPRAHHRSDSDLPEHDHKQYKIRKQRKPRSGTGSANSAKRDNTWNGTTARFYRGNRHSFIITTVYS